MLPLTVRPKHVEDGNFLPVSTPVSLLIGFELPGGFGRAFSLCWDSGRDGRAHGSQPYMIL